MIKFRNLVVAGDLNVNLSEPEGGRRGEDIVEAMATEGLEDMPAHFLPRRRSWFRYRRTWSMIWESREGRSRIDYILGTDCRLFGNVSVRDPRNNSDHYMVLGCLHSAPLRENARYLRVSNQLPLCLLTAPTREDRISASLQRAVLKPLSRNVRKNAWISEATWILVNERVSVRRYPAKDQALICRLGCAIAASLRDNRRWKAEEAGAEVELLIGLYSPLHLEAWLRIKGCYRSAFNCALPPARVTLKRITAERVELYGYVPPLGENIPISVEQLLVDDSVPTEDDIEWAVKRLRNHRSGGPSRMWDEHLERCLASATKAEK